MMKWIYFITQTDSDVISECGVYDKFLVIASFFRQLASFLISFFVFTYGTSLFLATWQAVIISFLIAALLFLVDMSIIASKWSLNPIYNDFKSLKQRVIAHVTGNIIVFFKLIPRVIFAIAIGFCIATIAEMGIMKKAIDEVLQQDALALNQTYWQQINNEKDRLKAQQDVLQKEADRLAELVQQRKAADNEAVKYSDSYIESVNTRYQSILTRISEQEDKLANAKQSLVDKKAELSLQQGIFDSAEAQKKLEAEDEDRGALKGPRWREQNNIAIEASGKIGVLKSEVEQLNGLVASLESELNEKNAEQKQVADEVASIEKVQAETQSTGKSLAELNAAYEAKLTELQTLKANETQALEDFKSTLSRDGLFYETANDPLGRYLALEKLHKDPEYGQAALLFSWGLKIFLIILELAPVLTMIFLSPYSFYQQKMRLKRRKFESEIKRGIIE